MLLPPCLLYGASGCVVYNPHRVRRQYGYDQGVPTIVVSVLHFSLVSDDEVGRYYGYELACQNHIYDYLDKKLRRYIGWLYLVIGDIVM